MWSGYQPCQHKLKLIYYIHNYNISISTMYINMFDIHKNLSALQGSWHFLVIQKTIVFIFIDILPLYRIFQLFKHVLLWREKWKKKNKEISSSINLYDWCILQRVEKPKTNIANQYRLRENRVWLAP